MTTDLSQLTHPKPLKQGFMSDGSEMFPYLWRYFLHHEPLRDWLMRAHPYGTASVAPRDVAQGIAFCCNFVVPDQWKDMTTSFDLGEMFIPDHAYSHFMCGTVVAATSYHKHLVCALGPAANRHPKCLPSYQTTCRRMIVDMGSSRSINIIEFSWMQDGALIVTVKILVPPDPNVPYQSAGCTGAFALFSDVIPGGHLPTVPKSLVSFVEVPRCPFCTARGSLGCYCSGSLAVRGNRQSHEYSSAVWPPKIPNDVKGPAVDTYHNIRARLDMIQHIAHVKITAHVVSPHLVRENCGSVSKTYKLGPSRFVVRAVLFRPAKSFEADTLRQVADKIRLLAAGSLSVTHSLMITETENGVGNNSGIAKDGNNDQALDLGYFADETGEYPTMEGAVEKECPEYIQRGHAVRFPAMFTTESSRASIACSIYSRNGKELTQSSRQDSLKTKAASSRSSGLAKSATVSIQDVASKVTETISQAPVSSKPLICPKCNKAFSQQGSLNRHLKNIHEERKIPCQYCNMSFGQMFDLKRHQRRKHAEKYTPITRRGSSDLRICKAKATRPVNHPV